MGLGGIRWFRGEPQFEAEYIKGNRQLAAYNALGRAIGGGYGALTDRLRTMEGERETLAQLQAETEQAATEANQNLPVGESEFDELQAARNPQLSGAAYQARNVTGWQEPGAGEGAPPADAPGRTLQERAGAPSILRRVGAILGLAEQQPGMAEERGRLKGIVNRMEMQRRTLNAMGNMLLSHAGGPRTAAALAPDVVPENIQDLLGPRYSPYGGRRGGGGGGSRGSTEPRQGSKDFVVRETAIDLAVQRGNFDADGNIAPTSQDWLDALRMVPWGNQYDVRSEPEPDRWAAPDGQEFWTGAEADAYMQSHPEWMAQGLEPRLIKGARQSQKHPTIPLPPETERGTPVSPTQVPRQRPAYSPSGILLYSPKGAE